MSTVNKPSASVKTINKEVNGIIGKEGGKASTPRRNKTPKSKSPNKNIDKNSENLTPPKSPRSRKKDDGTPKSKSRKKAKDAIVKEMAESQNEIGIDVKHEGGEVEKSSKDDDEFEDLENFEIGNEFEGGDIIGKTKPYIQIDQDENLNEKDDAEMEFEK